MKLLEKHHENLAQLLKFRISHPQSAEAISPERKLAEHGALSSLSPLPRELSSYRSPPPNPLSTHLPQREISSSIASNLASARGIPSSRQRKGTPASPTVTQYTENRVLSTSSKSRPGETTKAPYHGAPSENVQGVHQKQPLLKASAAEPVQSSSFSRLATNTTSTEDSPSSRNDEPFQRFYAKVENLFSTLSAPLAFAGLPLNIGEPAISTPNPSPSAFTKTEEQLPPTDPEFSKIFSRAALRALREEHGGAATGGPFNGAESFYVVPTTGGTISYAEILARAQQDANRQSSKINNSSNSDEQLDDEFVDARETPQPASPVSSRRLKPGTKTMEELQLENEALRALADKVCRRLFEFEMGAQTSSLALQRSIRAMQGSSGTGHAGPTDNDVNPGKIAELEGQLAKVKREAEQMEKENEKLKHVVGRYRERWEKIKEGAKARREPIGDGGG